MKTFKQIFYEHQGNLCMKWTNYFDIYDKHFSKYREQPINILEIGVAKGGSMQIYEKYFPKANVFGVDIDPDCKQYETDRTKIIIGDSSDKTFLRTITSQIPQLDIIIDDGGHQPEQQINAFEELYYHLKKPGVYLVEDTEKNFQKHKGSVNFMDHMKGKIDELNVRRTMHIRESSSYNWKDQEVRFADNTNSITFYDNVVVLEKNNMIVPKEVKWPQKT